MRAAADRCGRLPLAGGRDDPRQNGQDDDGADQRHEIRIDGADADFREDRGEERRRRPRGSPRIARKRSQAAVHFT